MSEAIPTIAMPPLLFTEREQQVLVAPKLDDITAKGLSSTNFRSGNSAKDIVTKLHSALERLVAVIVFKRDQLKFECSIKTPHGAVLVHARVYSDNGEHIIEIQRRSGCSVGFCMIWRRLLADPDIEGLQTQTQAPAHGLAESMDVEVDL